jgi:hypothetical protein
MHNYIADLAQWFRVMDIRQNNRTSNNYSYKYIERYLYMSEN